jgi:two-component system, response regulator, stage 0 sporulation protein A
MSEMLGEISVLIADDNIEFGNLLNRYLGQEEDIRIIGIARDGLEAVEMITERMPDIVVLDLIMPNLDGIGVLEKLSTVQLERKPLFIVLTAIGQDIFIQKAISLGAEYYIVKPFDMNVLVSRIRQVYNEENVSPIIQNNAKHDSITQTDTDVELKIEREVTNLMHEIGIPPHMSGYRFVREAIIMTISSFKTFSSITRVLYPTVAKKYKSTPQKVERAIRNAIECAWERGNPGSLNAIFRYTVNYSKGKPTNSEFIAMIADRVRINISPK